MDENDSLVTKSAGTHISIFRAAATERKLWREGSVEFVRPMMAANRASVIAAHHTYFTNAIRCYDTGVMMGLYAPPTDAEARSLEYMRDLLHKRHVRIARCRPNR
jgi:hypothetical protein